ncbi:MAG: NAD-dependent epimerase/dehydratase family protein [Eubacteriales bacterium]|nr:NAD-dependent epimerase/dehydratase family protein [Eubacteriales bacterium]
MKLLLIGGTGIISSAVSDLALHRNHELWLITRGLALHTIPSGAHVIHADIQTDSDFISTAIKNEYFDCIADFTVQTPDQIERDYDLFHNKTKQYIFISSACVYKRPLPHYILTEDSPVGNPYWNYAQNKLACEEKLQKIANLHSFPFTIIRPGHTYDDTWLPLCITGYRGGYAVIQRMLEGRATIIPGDGTSLWTVTHNSDFAAAFLGIAGNPAAVGEIVQISSDEILSWNQIYHTIAELLDVPFRPFYVSSLFLHQAGPYDFQSCLIGERVQSAVLCNDKLKKLVPGFHAKTSFRTGIKPALEHLLADPALQIADPVFDSWCDRLIDVLGNVAKELKREFPEPL